MATTARAALLAALTLLASLLLVPGAAPAQAAVSVYPLPTSNAGVERIVTAPDGSMWFIETEVGKVGRITTSGQIQEFDLPPTTTGSVDGSVYGIDVGADGVVWVTYDYGRKIVSLNPATGATAIYGLGAYPYGGAVRVGTDGRVFVTMNYDDSGIATLAPGASSFFWSANAPACDDVLGRAGDGSMWCQGGDASGQDTIVKVNGDATGGVTYPLPSDATYPNGLAAGPVGSIWFTRSSSGTIFTSPSNGSIGYLDASSGATKIWQTGSRSAPSDLLLGPDGQMWFTNIGAVPGIGHISANGVGAVTSVGNYEPHSLTFGTDGAIWFTDTKNNSIVRVTTDQLQTTNVDLGTGVTMTAPATPPTPPTPPSGGVPVGAIPKVKGVTPVKRGKVKVPVACPATATAPCAGTLQLETAKGGKALAKAKAYSVKAGKKSKVTVKLTKKGIAKLRRGKVVKVRVELTAPGSKKVLAKRTIKVRRR
jgi:virginiamycin B lyase